MSLDMGTFRRANLGRLAEFKNNKGEPAHTTPDGSDWSLTDWATAVSGELGEACNIIKKIRRGDLSIENAMEDLSDELADVFIYLDLLSYRSGIDLSQAVIEKWNKTSEKIGYRYRLTEFGSLVSAPVK